LSCKTSEAIKITRVVEKGENKDYFWIIREYIDGASLSDNMTAYDDIKSIFFKKDSSFDYLSQITDNIDKFKRIITYLSEEEKKTFFAHNSRKVLENPLEFIEQSQKKPLFDLENQKKFLESIHGEYYNVKNLSVTMGDLNPANIIVSRDHKVFFSDVSNMTIDNKILDVAYLWIFFWMSQKWQKKLIKKFIKTKTDENFFRFSIIRVSVPFAWQNNQDMPKVLSKRHQYWQKYLIAAGESFEAIMKVK